MSDDPRDFPTVSTRDGYSRYAYSFEIDAMEEEERLRDAPAFFCRQCGGLDILGEEEGEYLQKECTCHATA